jgi:hypothetical protein
MCECERASASVMCDFVPHAVREVCTSAFVCARERVRACEFIRAQLSLSVYECVVALCVLFSRVSASSLALVQA